MGITPDGGGVQPFSSIAALRIVSQMATTVTSGCADAILRYASSTSSVTAPHKRSVGAREVSVGRARERLVAGAGYRASAGFIELYTGVIGGLIPLDF